MLISVIIPVYNAEKTIRKCVESIQIQDIKEIEIILVNDGSTDESLKICRELEAEDTRNQGFDRKKSRCQQCKKQRDQRSQGRIILHL